LERLLEKGNVKYKLVPNITNEKTKENKKAKGLLQEASDWKEEDWQKWFEG